MYGDSINGNNFCAEFNVVLKKLVIFEKTLGIELCEKLKVSHNSKINIYKIKEK